MFALHVGSGVRTDGGAHTLNQAFVNNSTLSGLTCSSGTSYSAAATDDRDLEVTFNDAGTVVSLSPMKIKSVPFALQAHEIDGWGLNNIVKVSTLGSPTTFTVAEMANAKAITGAACNSGEVLKWNGTAWACAADITTGASSDAGYTASNKGIVAFDTNAATSGITVTSGVASVNAGTGNNQIVKLDGSAKLPAVDGSALTNLDPAHLSAAVPITKGGTGQITAVLGFNALSPITTKGDLITSDGTNNVRLPAGSNGYVLTADSAQTNGIKWAPITTGTVTSVSSANADIAVASGTSTPVLTLNSGTGNNQIVKLDGSAKLPAVDGSALTNLNAGNIASGTLPVTRGGTGSTTFGNNGVIISNGTGSALQTLNCTSGQVVTFDVSGYAVCGASAGSSFVNGGNSFGGNATLGTNDAYSLGIKTNNTARMTILSTGEIGIGTTAPAAKLEVAGEVKVGNTALACSATTKGSIRYNNASSALEFCNGTSWNLVQAAACSDATPNVISFADQANATASTLYASNIVQVTGINCSVPVTISGSGSPQFQICSDASCGTVVQGWTNSPSSITNNQYLQVRLTSDSSGGSVFQSTIIVGSGATVWTVTNAGGDCTASPSVGTVCADGTIYAGISPDGNAPMFTTRCDVGQTWSGVACTGVRANLNWNNGTSNYVSTGVASTLTGRANTSTLNGLADAGAPYNSAQYCDSLNINGKTDWYLPALSELVVLYNGKDAIKNFDTSGNYYWSSSESGSNLAKLIIFNNGTQTTGNKNFTNLVRCVRR